MFITEQRSKDPPFYVQFCTLYSTVYPCLDSTYLILYSKLSLLCLNVLNCLQMLECLVSGADPPAFHRCFFCQMSLAAGEKYIEHMRHHLADYKNLQPRQPLITAAKAAPPEAPRPSADRAGRVRRFRKRRLKPAVAVKVVKKEVEEVESFSHAVSDDDCLGDSELSDSDSDSCQLQTEKVRDAAFSVCLLSTVFLFFGCIYYYTVNCSVVKSDPIRFRNFFLYQE